MDPAVSLLLLSALAQAGETPVKLEERLHNGLTVVIQEDRQAPAVTARLTILGAGELYTAVALSGQASFTARMLAKGTRGRSAAEIAEQLNRFHATLESTAPHGGDTTAISLTAPPDTFEQALFLTADVLVNPAFPQAEFDALRGQELAALDRQAADPRALLNARFLQAVYGAHPASLESATPATLNALTRDHLVKWHRERYAPQNSTLAITGPVNARDILNKVKRLNFVWTRMGFTPKLPELPAPSEKRRIYLIDQPGATETLLRLGIRTVPRDHPDHAALIELARVRGAIATTPPAPIPGTWSLSLSVPTGSTGSALEGLLNDLQRMAEEAPAAAKYLNLDSIQIIAAGDAAKIRESLAAFGPVVEDSGR
jgi:zinc protease